MRKLILIPICAIALIVPFAVLASSGEGGFDGVVHNIEHQYHVKASRIPLMGLVSLVARGASHGSVSGLHIAEFEDFSADVDGQDLNRMVEEKLGPEWERVIRETSRRGNSQTLIYMRAEGNRMGMFVLDADGRDLNVVQMSVDPRHLEEEVRRYRHESLDMSD
jgi:hypothetical protein